MTIIEWKQHHAFGMMTEMPNDKQQQQQNVLSNAAQ